MGRLKLSRETEFLVANGDRETSIFVFCSADHDQDWRACPVGPY